MLSHDLRNAAHFQRVGPETFRPEALIDPADRDPVDIVLRRTAALLADLKKMAGDQLAAFDASLAELRQAVADTAKLALTPVD